MLSKLSKFAFHQSFALNGLILRSACATQTLQFHRNLFLTKNCLNKVLQNMPDLQGTRPTEHNQKSEKKKSKWLRKVLAFSGALGLGLIYASKEPKDYVPLPVKVDPAIPPIIVSGVNIFPLLRTIFSLLPESTVQNISVSSQAPKLDNPILDRHDCTGKTPYKINEILKNSVWQVEYQMENFPITSESEKNQAKAFGIDPNSKEYQDKVLDAAKSFSEEAVRVVKEDFKSVIADYEKKFLLKEERFELPPFKLNMMVVKMKNGGLLLYAPVKVHIEESHLLTDWLKSLGNVEYIVVASSFHTLCVPDVLKAFPNAKVVGPKCAEEKLKYCKAIEKFDFVTTEEDGIKSANDELNEKGIKVFDIKGDVACNAVVCLVQNEVLLSCDVLYGNHNGGMHDLDRSNLLTSDDYPERLFYFSMIAKPNSPNGFLPNYRFWMMDPMSLGALGYQSPKADGSSCREMANSLRQVLSQPFKTAAGVHFKTMDRDSFQKSVDCAWNWLDGKPLE